MFRRKKEIELLKTIEELKVEIEDQSRNATKNFKELKELYRVKWEEEKEALRIEYNTKWKERNTDLVEDYNRIKLKEHEFNHREAENRRLLASLTSAKESLEIQQLANERLKRLLVDKEVKKKPARKKITKKNN
jgi:hypothetical protein